MSHHVSRRSARPLLAGFAGAALLLAAAAPAVQAEAITPQATRALTCRSQALSLGSTAATLGVWNLPETVPVGSSTQIQPSWSVRFDGPGAARTFNRVGAAQIEGSMRLPLLVADRAAGVPGTATTASLAAPPSIAFNGTLGAFPLETSGPLPIKLNGEITMIVLLRDESGIAIEVPGVDIDVDSDEQPWETDGDLTRHTVRCTVDAGQDPLLRTVTVTAPAAVAPTALTAKPGETTAELAWSSAETKLKHHEGLCGNTAHFLVTEPKVTVTDLEPGKTYTCEVWTVNRYGERSAATSITFTTKVVEQETALSYGVTGVASLKSLASGTLPLSGGLKLTVSPTGQISAGELKLDPTSANLKALGFIPVSAKLAFENVGQASGSLAQEKLTLEQRLRVRLQDVRLFGLPLTAGISNCQTRSATTVKLVSDKPVTAAGGSLLGSFPISDLSGCGGLNGLVNSLTASNGNTIRLTLGA